MVAGSRHHALYAHARQRAEKEQSRLRPGAIYLSAREQRLPLSGRRATELCGFERAQSRPCLYRQRQTLWSMLTKSTMHHWTKQVSRHSHPRVSSATRTRVGEHGRVNKGTTSTQESGSIICRTQESDRIASLAPAEIEVCARAVLPGSGCAEHQATGAVSQPADHTCSAAAAQLFIGSQQPIYGYVLTCGNVHLSIRDHRDRKLSRAPRIVASEILIAIVYLVSQVGSIIGS